MAYFSPFFALRPKPEYARAMCSPPYDVLDRQEAARIAENNPYSFLRVSRSEIEFPPEADPYSEAVYERARDKLRLWLEQGVLIREARECYLIYRQTDGKHVQTGVVGCAGIADYENKRIRRHEVTREEKERDRTRHFDVCGAHTEPVFLAYRSSQVIDVTVKKWTEEQEPVYDFKAGDGVVHQLWVVNDPGAIEVLAIGFEDVPRLYIADGHHRAASAVAVAKMRQAQQEKAEGKSAGGFLAVCFPTFDLEIMDYNRLVSDLNGLTEDGLLAAIERAGFRIGKIKGAAHKPERRGSFAMYLQRQWYSLEADPKLRTGDPIGDLDVSILQERILGPILGIRDPRTDERIDFAGGIRGLSELERRVRGGSAAAAFALHPVSMDELLAAADAGRMMPPKSTWFEPKLASGLFIHQME